MFQASRSFVDLTAQDLMTRDVITIPQGMSLQAAAHRLAQAGVSGAPVVDAAGRCIGVLSKTDLVRFLDQGPRTCRCHEPAPTGYSADWQVFDLEGLPGDDVTGYMTSPTITACLDARVGQLARLMAEAHVHRILILDGWERVIGVVSSMDVLGAVAAEDAWTNPE